MSFIVRGKPSPWSKITRSTWRKTDVKHIYITERLFCITDKKLKYNLKIDYYDDVFTHMYIHRVPLFNSKKTGTATYRYETYEDALYDHIQWYKHM